MCLVSRTESPSPRGPTSPGASRARSGKLARDFQNRRLSEPGRLELTRRRGPADHDPSRPLAGRGHACGLGPGPARRRDWPRCRGHGQPVGRHRFRARGARRRGHQRHAGLSGQRWQSGHRRPGPGLQGPRRHRPDGGRAWRAQWWRLPAPRRDPGQLRRGDAAVAARAADADGLRAADHAAARRQPRLLAAGVHHGRDFRPIPLGLGFTLQAIGGMLGVYRTFDVAVCARACRTTR